MTSQPTTSNVLKGQLKAGSRARREELAAMAALERAAGSKRNDLLPLSTLEYVPLDQLKLPVRNIRGRSAPHITRVRQSMLTLGAATPAIVTHAYEVVDGATRLAAAGELGLDAYPCFVLPASYTPDEIRLLRLTLNRTQELGQFALPELKLELQELRAIGAPLEVTSFTIPEIDQLCLDDVEIEVDVGPLEPDRSRVSVVRLGDIFELGPHRIVCGDARDPDVLAQLFEGDDQAALLLTDVPYNLRVAGLVTSGDHAEFAMASGEMSRDEFVQFNADWMVAAEAHVRNGGLLASFIDFRSVEILLAQGRTMGLALLNMIVWAKTNGGQGSLWRSQHELLPVFKKGAAPHTNNVELGRHGRWRSNVWNYPGASSLGSDAREGLKAHPTVKPTTLLEDALLDVTRPDEIVLDVFLGSGSLLMAAEATQRRCRAVEIEPHYVEVALRRWMTATGRMPTLASSGETFEALSHRRAQAEDQPSTTTPKARIRVKAGQHRKDEQ